MDIGNKKLLRDRLDAKNFRFSSKVEVGQKVGTFYSKRKNNV
jgi:hypothetical protein